jgi:hypothetical protein
MKPKRILFLSLFLLFSASTFAQRVYTDNMNAWLVYTGSHKLSDKWGLHLEIQIRRNDLLAKGQQLLLRPGINYYFNGQATATVGYGFVETYPYGEFAAKSKFPEHRLWEQLQLKTQLDRFEIINRFRLEQRWVHAPALQPDSTYAAGDAIYSNRFRVMGRVSVPFKGKTIEDKSFYLAASDELFVNFGKNVAFNIFDQNRAYIGLGYKLPKIGRLEIGYLNQLVVKSDAIKIESNHTVQVALNSTIDFRKKQAAK